MIFQLCVRIACWNGNSTETQSDIVQPVLLCLSVCPSGVVWSGLLPCRYVCLSVDLEAWQQTADCESSQTQLLAPRVAVQHGSHERVLVDPLCIDQHIQPNRSCTWHIDSVARLLELEMSLPIGIDDVAARCIRACSRWCTSTARCTTGTVASSTSSTF